MSRRLTRVILMPRIIWVRGYQNGRGVPQDDAEAIKWYLKAAEKGDAAARNNLGWMCQNGRGVPQDDAEAVKWYLKAAEQGNADARIIWV